MKRSDIGVTAVFYAVCAFFFVMTIRLPEAAQTYPLCLIGGLFLLTTLYAVRSVFSWLRTRTIEEDIKQSFAGFKPIQFAVCLGLGLAYMLLMKYAGFYIATVLYMAATMLYLRVSKMQMTAAVIIMMAVIYAVFTLFLKVPLPAGLLMR